MKKLLSICASLLALVLVLTACSSKTETKENVTIKVASHTAPMTDMLEMIKDDLKKKDITLN